MGDVLTIQDFKLGVDAQTPQTQTFAYDNLYRLVSAVIKGGLNGMGDYDESSSSGLGNSYDLATGNLSGIVS